MNRKKIIIAIIILLSVLLLLGCVTGDKYKTYRLKGVPLNHETTFILLSWIHTTDDDVIQELKVINKTNNTKEFQIFEFEKRQIFTIECDITFDSEIEGIEQENYSFIARFNRIQYTDEKISLLLYLFLKSRI